MLRLKQFTLFLGDFLALFLGLYSGVYLRYLSLPGLNIINLLPHFLLLFLAAAVIMFIIGLYDVGRAKNNWPFYQKIIISAVIWVGLGIIYFYLIPNAEIAPKTILLLAALTGFGLLSLWRYFYNRFLSATIWKTNIIFAGITPEVLELIELINNQPGHGLQVVGCVLEPSQTAVLSMPSFASIALAGSLSELAAKLPDKNIDLIVIAPSFINEESLLKELYGVLFRQIGLMQLAEFYEKLFRRVPPFTFSESWFIEHLQEQSKKMYDRFRILFDYLVAIIMGIFFVITFPFIALAIKITSAGPIFFIQERCGRNGKPFNIIKFRTMKALAADGSAELSGPQYASLGDNRITKIGLYLRRCRLDELPQFINIFKGEMALIGPRPERPSFVAELTAKMPYYNLRHLIKPGLTGWAQLQQSYYDNVHENLRKLEYDLFYLKNRGPLLDLAIILRTINVLIGMNGR